MPRLMSVAFTEQAVRDRTKTVTRRKGWEFLQPGDRLTLCRKVMGRKPGEPLERIADVEVVSVRREQLDLINPRDVDREGFPGMTPEEFVRTFFIEAQGMRGSDTVTRIEWRYLDEEAAAGTGGSTRGRANRRRGADAERAVCKWLRANGFPHAERAVRTGFTAADRSVADHGDITGTPGIVWQVKDVKRSSIPTWLMETAAQRLAAKADAGVLVYRVRGCADVGGWRGWLLGGNGLLVVSDQLLSIVVRRLRREGFGEPLDTGGSA